MLRFFRTFRQRLLTDNKFSKYLLYAVGEIVLVVIGILIALQVNNLNEERKTEDEIKAILQRVLTELENNIDEAKGVFLYYEVADSLSHWLINDRLSRQDLQPNGLSFGVPVMRISTLVNHSLSLVQSSYDQLMGNVDNIPPQYLPVVDSLVDLYENKKKSILTFQSMLVAENQQNASQLKKLPFWVNSGNQPTNSNNEYFDYILNNEEFKGEYVLHNATYSQQLVILSLFRAKAIHIHKQISSLLGMPPKKETWAMDKKIRDKLKGGFIDFRGDTLLHYERGDLMYVKGGYAPQDTLIHHLHDNKFYYSQNFMRIEKDGDSLHMIVHRFGGARMATKILK